MAIMVTNLQKKLRLNTPRIKKLIKKILEKFKKNIANVSVVFVNKSEIKRLNKKFLGKNYLTDVLSFDNSIKFPRKISFWEIVICTDAAIKNAEIFKTSQDYELRLYLLHGILHLLGFDDNNAKKRKMMQKKENEILKILDLT